MRRISDGVKISERYKTSTKSKSATVEDQGLNFLYQDADHFIFMDPEPTIRSHVFKETMGRRPTCRKT